MGDPLSLASASEFCREINGGITASGPSERACETNTQRAADVPNNCLNIVQARHPASSSPWSKVWEKPSPTTMTERCSAVGPAWHEWNDEPPVSAHPRAKRMTQLPAKIWDGTFNRLITDRDYHTRTPAETTLGTRDGRTQGSAPAGIWSIVGANFPLVLRLKSLTRTSHQFSSRGVEDVVRFGVFAD